MAKTDTTTTDAAAPAQASEFPVTLDEVCTRLSAGDKRVELIAAFHHDETAAGRLRDLESLYLSRFAAFAARPV
ncbi:hypothetical protein [Azospirillum sp.]|uniref:hypothetical protein n=1 Tax=Azospirillum sp. TaxID=34012 RepID=UPI003D72DCB6